MSHNNSGQWQQNYLYTLVDENDNSGGGKQSPNSSEKLSPKMVGGEFPLCVDDILLSTCNGNFNKSQAFLSLNFVLSITKLLDWLKGRQQGITRNYKKHLNRKFPITDWLPHYNLSFAISDLIAGLTVGLTVIPQGIAYAIVAGLPPQYGQ